MRSGINVACIHRELRRRCRIALFVAVSSVGGAFAAAVPVPPVVTAAGASDVGTAATFIQGILHEKVKIIREFPAPLDLMGYVIEVPQEATPLKPPSYAVVYMDANHTHLLAGVGIFDAKGVNFSRSALAEYAPLTDYTAALQATEASAYLAEGKPGAPVVYAFFDANCIFCNRLWSQTRDLVKEGRLQLRWVPVGILKKDSEDKGAGILAASDPVAALTEDEVSFNTKDEEGGFSITHEKISKDKLQAVQANDALMKLAGFYGTPTLLYVTKAGVAMAKQGLPSAQDWKDILLDAR